MNNNQDDKFFKTVYENLPAGVMQFQKNGEDLSLLHINNFGCQILNYQKNSENPFDFHTFIDRLPGNAYKEFITALDKLKAPGESFPFTRPVYVGDKKSWLSGTAALLSEKDKLPQYLCVFTDDTVNVELRMNSDSAKEKEIQILNEMCTLIVSRSYETLGLIDIKTGKYCIYAAQDNDWFSNEKLKGDFNELTRRAADELGYDKEGKRLLSEGTVDSLICHLDHAPHIPYTITYRIKTRESYRWKRAEYSYLKDDKTRIIFCTQDIHSEKMEEEHLAKLAQKERQIHQEKMTFFANMSHEIRTPMNAVLNLSELLLRKELPLDVEQDVSKIYEISNGLLGIINSLLSFSKLDTGNIQLTEGNYSPSALISDVCSMISARLIQKNVYFFTDVDPSMPRELIGDEMHLREILVNLLANAVKFTASGKIELKLRTQPLSDNSTRLLLSVSDTGSGIRKEDQKQLFHQFSRIDAKKNQTISGTGLGLSISKKLTELMGGTISVESDYGKGSIFTVSIPQKINFSEEMIPISKKIRQSEVYLYFPDSDEELIRYVVREMRKIDIYPSIVSSLSSVCIGDQAISYLIMKQSSASFCQNDVDQLFLPDHVLLLMKNSEATASQYYSYHQIYPYNLMIQTTNILNGQAVRSGGKTLKIYEDTVFPSASILIVDDNAVNSSVAKRLMEPYEMEIDLASNGYEALEMISQKNYDLIFLDHMMPGMDGIETVQKLRNMDNEKQNLPVIALTANVFSDAKSYFAQKGFTGFLAKPINIKELHNILLQYLQDKAIIKRKKEKESPAFIPEDIKSCFAPLKHFNVQASLDYFDHSVDFYLEMLKTYHQGLFERRMHLEDICKAKDIHLFTINVHAIKSASQSVGAFEYSKAAKILEDFGHDHNWGAIAQKFTEFINYTDVILGELDQCLRSIPSDKKKREICSCYPENLIKNLCIAVNEMDYQHVSNVINELDQYAYPPELQKLLNRLKTAYDNFEYGDLGKYSILMYNCL